MFPVFICSRPKRSGVILNQKLESCVSMVQLPALLLRQYYSHTTEICHLCISRVVLLCQPFQSELGDFQHTSVLQAVVIPKQFTQEHQKYFWNGRNAAVSLESQATSLLHPIQYLSREVKVGLPSWRQDLPSLLLSFFHSFVHSFFSLWAREG